MATVHFLHTATLLANGKVLAVGGEDAGYAVHGAEFYDPVTNSWSPAGTMHIERSRHAATLLLDGTVLVSGGFNNTIPSVLTSAEVYDPANNSWSETRCLNDPRILHNMSLLRSGTILAAGGIGNGNEVLASVELYTPDNPVPTLAVSAVQATNVGDNDATIAWLTDRQGDTQVEYGTDTSYGHVTTLHPALVLSHAIELTSLTPDTLYHFRVLSHDAGGNLVMSDDFTITTLSPLPTDTPTDTGTPTDTPTATDTATATSTPVPTASPTPTATPTSTPTSTATAVPGCDPYVDLPTSFNGTASWTAIAPMLTARADPQATILCDGRVLVVGGSDGTTTLDSVEIYDPATNSWAMTAPMHAARVNHTVRGFWTAVCWWSAVSRSMDR